MLLDQVRKSAQFKGDFFVILLVGRCLADWKTVSLELLGWKIFRPRTLAMFLATFARLLGKSVRNCSEKFSVKTEPVSCKAHRPDLLITQRNKNQKLVDDQLLCHA